MAELNRSQQVTGRQAAEHLKQAHRLSNQRACGLPNLAMGSYNYRRQTNRDDDAVRATLRGHAHTRRELGLVAPAGVPWAARVLRTTTSAWAVSTRRRAATR